MSAKENNQFWGEGFTEWDNVKRALPNFNGHLQPNLPIKGISEFDSPEFLVSQMKLASSHSISAFCIYSYWFSGRKVMTRAFDFISITRELPIDFCVAWANENWTRRWDGAESEVLIQQKHDADTDSNFIDDHFSLFSHPNYLRINGKPALLIYRPNLMADPKQTVENMRVRARKLGLGELSILMVQFFEERDPRAFGFDGAVQFPPNFPNRAEISMETHDNFTGKILDYDSVMNFCLTSQSDFTEYQGVMPDWDNTPRKRERATTFIGATQEKFSKWMEMAWEKMKNSIPEEDDKVIFINAWNEWGEGAHLEPGQNDKYDALFEVKRVFESRIQN